MTQGNRGKKWSGTCPLRGAQKCVQQDPDPTDPQRDPEPTDPHGTVAVVLGPTLQRTNPTSQTVDRPPALQRPCPTFKIPLYAYNYVLLKGGRLDHRAITMALSVHYCTHVSVVHRPYNNNYTFTPPTSIHSPV